MAMETVSSRKLFHVEQSGRSSVRTLRLLRSVYLTHNSLRVARRLLC
jgi:hypothetical protein